MAVPGAAESVGRFLRWMLAILETTMNENAETECHRSHQ